MKQESLKKLGVWPDERFDEDSFHIARLAETGIGSACPGERFRVYVGRHDLGKVAEVVSVVEKRLRELTGEDGARILRAPANGVRDLQLRLESLYAFRPRWRGDDSLVRIIQLRVFEFSNGRRGQANCRR